MNEEDNKKDSIKNEQIIGADFNNKTIDNQPVDIKRNFSEIIDPDIKPIRTYENDVANAISKNNTSLASMTVAEKVRNEQKAESNVTGVIPPDKHYGTKAIITIISIVFVFIGLAGIYYFYSNSIFGTNTKTEPIKNTKPSSLIKSDSQKTIDITGLSKNKIIEVLTNELNKTQEANSLKDIILTKKDAGATYRLTGPQIIELFAIPAPNIVTRTIVAPWMLGVYNDNTSNKSFVIVFTTNYFQNAFAGLLEWERYMMDDIKQYLYDSNIKNVSNSNFDRRNTGIEDITPERVVGSTTASTTIYTEENTLIDNNFTIRGRFVDKIIRNKDVRVFQNDNNQNLFMYSIIDGKYIVFSNTQNAVEDIIKRLEKSASIR
jgi:hypothetical protein